MTYSSPFQPQVIKCFRKWARIIIPITQMGTLPEQIGDMTHPRSHKVSEEMEIEPSLSGLPFYDI